MKDLDKFVELLIQIVDDESMRWEEKRRVIRAAASDDHALDTALEEFLSWFQE